MLEDVSPILEPLAEATELLTKEDMPTAGSVLILINKLLTEDLQANEEDSSLASTLKSDISSKLQARFKLNEEGLPDESIVTSPMVIAAALDPRYKALRFLTTEQREEVHEFVKELMSDCVESTSTQSTESTSTTLCTDAVIKEDPDMDSSETFPRVSLPAKKRLCSYILGDVVDLTCEDLSQKTNELQDFVQEKVRLADPLQWWKLNAPRFPRLAKLAKRYLPIPATEVASERIFSTAGNTITKLRASLDPETADQLIFLHKNSQEKGTQSTPCTDQEEMPLPMVVPPVKVEVGDGEGQSTLSATASGGSPAGNEDEGSPVLRRSQRSRSRRNPRLPTLASSSSESDMEGVGEEEGGVTDDE